MPAHSLRWDFKLRQLWYKEQNFAEMPRSVLAICLWSEKLCSSMMQCIPFHQCSLVQAKHQTCAALCLYLSCVLSSRGATMALCSAMWTGLNFYWATFHSCLVTVVHLAPVLLKRIQCVSENYSLLCLLDGFHLACWLEGLVISVLCDIFLSWRPVSQVRHVTLAGTGLLYYSILMLLINFNMALVSLVYSCKSGRKI